MDQGQNNKVNNVIETCKQAYITRLFNRNPLLHFAAKTTKSSDRFCISDFFVKKSNSTESLMLEQYTRLDPIIAAYTLVRDLLNNLDTTINQPEKSLVAKLQKQRTASKELMHMTGQHSLFIGYPMLYATLDNKSPIFAPLFMIPVTVTVDSSKISVSRVKLKDDVMPVTVNPLLTSWGEKYKDIKIDWNLVVQSLNKNTDTNTLNDEVVVFSQLKQLTKDWAELDPITEQLSVSFESAPTEKELKSWGEQKLSTRVVNCAVLGVVKYSGCSLLQDLESLALKPETDLGILKSLVTPRINVASEAPLASSDIDSWHIVDTDPPQKATIDQAKLSSWLVIQGPPGTGKSQTIVNLIGQALAKQQTVAVICEKPAALEVVKKRLAAVELDELTLLIKKPDQQRLQVIKGIKNINQDWADLSQKQAYDYRDKLANKICVLEQQIDNSMRGFYANRDKGLERYATVKARLHRLERELGYEPLGLLSVPSHIDLLKVFQSFNQEQSRDSRWFNTEWKNRVNAWKKTAIESNFATSPWREHRIDVAINVIELRQALAQINRILTIDSTLMSKRSAHWFSGHRLMGNTFARSFIDDEKRVAQTQLSSAIKSLDFLGAVLKRHNSKLSIDGLYTRSNLRYLEPIWLSSLGTANDVQQLMMELEQFAIGKVLLKHLFNQPDQWVLRLEAAVCSFWLNCWEAEFPHIYNSVLPLKRNLEQLQNLLVEKKSLDASDLRSKFSYRMIFRDGLEGQNLLRERTGKYGSKTQIRDLMSTGWKNTQKLHPILLTTPEVACEILPLQEGLFDLLIIDEASQMFTAEALPLIYRGKKVVIAGDNKQMPPSNFFNAAGDEEEDFDEEESEIGVNDDEAELVVGELTLIPALDNSCLLDAAEAVLPRSSPAQKLLKIHYRSSFRELIEFSNHAFYDGELEAPAGNLAATSILGRPIEFNQVSDAVFYKGVNEKEAQSIVNRIIQFWQQPDSPSLGVIVMNAQQKMKIEDLLREYAELNPAFSTRLEVEREREDRGEDVGFFIRNVENVQGDERDVIILGATYAGDSRRFGPLASAEHGRRRLNVAITRAKQGLVVFSSLNTMPRSGDETVNDKWYFLSYLRYASAVSSGNLKEVNLILDKLNPKRLALRNLDKYDSDFEMEVAEFLATHGYETEPQAPESGFRIDLAVKCTDRLGYLCGIECDGAAYHSSWTARSRDIWRQKILQDKGWNIYRIWSTDWFNDTERAKQNLLEHLKLRVLALKPLKDSV